LLPPTAGDNLKKDFVYVSEKRMPERFIKNFPAFSVSAVRTTRVKIIFRF